MTSHADNPVNQQSPSKPDILKLDTVTVIGKAEKPASEALPGTSSTIGAETIEKRLVRNIKDLIRYEPGVNVGNDPQRFGASGFNIRGLGGNRVLMLMDGVRQPDAFSFGSFASATRNAIDMDALKSVEIVRGSGSAQYGGDALGGTVSFVTKDPRDYLDIFGKDYYADLKLGYNTTDRSFLKTTTLTAAINGWESLLLFTHSESKETDTKGDNKSLNPTRTAPSPQDNLNFNLLGKLLYRFNGDNVLRLTGEWLQNQSNIDALHARGADFTSRTVNSLINDDSQSRWRLSLDQALNNIGFPVFDNLMWRAHFQQSATRQITHQDRTSAFEGRTLTERIFDYDTDSVGGELKMEKAFNLAFTDHVLRYGAQFNYDTIAQQRDGSVTTVTCPRFPGTCRPGDFSKFVTIETFPLRDFPLSTVTKVGAYAQDTVAVLDNRIELIPGIRLEYYRLSPEMDDLFAKGAEGIVPAEIKAAKFLPKFGALLHLNDVFTLHGQYAHGFRGPNFSDTNVGFTNFQAGYASIPNLNLQPETSVGAEIGLRGKGGAGNFDVTLFRNEYDKFIFGDTLCDPATSNACPNGFLIFQTVNSQNPIRMQGIEFKSELYLDWLLPSLQGTSVIVSGAFTEGEDLVTERTDARALRGISPMKGVVGLRYDRPSGNWGSEIILTLVGRKQRNTVPEEVTFLPRGYGVIDINAYYLFGEHLSLNIGVFNLLDKKYIDWADVNTRAGDPHVNLGPFAGANLWDRYSRPGRNVGFTVKLAY